jgi:isoleucyl-tRNA synthetase
MNVMELIVSQDKQKYGVQLKAEPNFRLLGARLKGDQKTVTNHLKTKVTEEELEKLLDEGKMTVLGYELTAEEVAISFTVDPNKTSEDEKWETAASSSVKLKRNIFTCE